MGRYTNKLIYLLLLHCSFLFAQPDQELIAAAESNDQQAQLELGIAYQEESKPKQAHYWYLKSALLGNKKAAFYLGQLFELNSNPTTPNLTLAENWYLLGSELEDQEAELGYGRVLEQQFNQRRQKQVSSIVLLDQQLDQELDKELETGSETQADPSSATSSTLSLSQIQLLELAFFLFLFVSIFIFVWFKRKRRNSATDKSLAQAQLITTQQKKIKQLQRHLSKAHQQLQQNQSQLDDLKNKQAKSQASKRPSPPPSSNSNSANSKLDLACAIMGFESGSIPDKPTIKARYKKLSRIYHPDANGSDEEMKRLNAAAKYLNSL